MQLALFDRYLLAWYACATDRCLVGPDLDKEWLLEQFERSNNLPVTVWTYELAETANTLYAINIATQASIRCYERKHGRGSWYNEDKSPAQP